MWWVWVSVSVPTSGGRRGRPGAMDSVQLGVHQRVLQLRDDAGVRKVHRAVLLGPHRVHLRTRPPVAVPVQHPEPLRHLLQLVARRPAEHAEVLVLQPLAAGESDRGFVRPSLPCASEVVPTSTGLGAGCRWGSGRWRSSLEGWTRGVEIRSPG